MTEPAATSPLPGTVATVTAADRMAFTAFLAVAVHVAAITGISFSMPEPRELPPSLEVILAKRDDQEAPRRADYLAQANQAGSGEQEEKAAPATDNPADYQEAEIRETVAPETRSAPPPEPLHEAQVLTAAKRSNERTRPQPQEQQPEEDSIDARELLARSLEIASLEARFELQRQEYARHPRVRRLTSASTQKARDAWFLDAWRRKVELVGNLNYPEEARRNRIYGSLRMMVALLPDGTVKDIRILESSGHKVLDDAAVRIVRLAEPFAPFPPDMRREVDILEIIRTWQFRSTLKSF